MAIDYDTMLSGFRDFFDSFPDVAAPLYRDRIEEMKREGKKLVIDCDHLITYDQTLYEALVSTRRPSSRGRTGASGAHPEQDLTCSMCGSSTLTLPCSGDTCPTLKRHTQLIQTSAIVGRTSEVKRR